METSQKIFDRLNGRSQTEVTHLGDITTIHGFRCEQLLGALIDADDEMVAVQILGLASDGHNSLAFVHSLGFYLVDRPVQAVEATEHCA